MTLDKLPTDKTARILKVEGHDSVMLRLMEMGLVPGTPVRVRKRAPFGGPLELKVRDYLLSIRAREAQGIVVETE
ncbi:MAG: ferrous iron transport protein A [Myxococcales bacterium]|nr:ferrous iron transport protein A [Myxococcales bacterium]MCB9651765.1 ferrous iron transport protein A [Deltaproteobacteria bacterium]